MRLFKQVGVWLALAFAAWAASTCAGAGVSAAADAAALDVASVRQQALAPWTRVCASAQNLSIDQVAAGACPFEPAGRMPFSRGFDERTLWLRFALVNSSDQALDRILSVGHPRLENVTLYTATPQGAWQAQHAGAAVPLAQQGIASALPMFALHLAAGEKRVVWISVRTRTAMDFDMTLWTPREIYYKDQLVRVIQALAMGCLLLCGVYGVGWFFAMRDRTALYFAGFMFAELLTEAARSGFLRVYLWPETRPYLIEWLLVGAQASIWTFALFMRSFIPRVLAYRRTYLAFHVLLIGLTLGFLWALFVDYASGIRFWTWWFWLVVAAFVALVTRATVDGIREARVILGYIVLLSGLEAFRLFVILGYVNSSFLQAVLSPWTYVLSTLMLLMAVSQRTTLIRNELVKVDADSAARLDFMLGMGHELRSPLNVIVGQTRLLERTSFNSEQRSGLLAIRQNAKQMLTMMDEILDYAQSQGRHLRLHLRPVSWGILTDRMKYDALALAVEQADQLDLSFEGPSDVLLQVDIRRLLQVVHNLLQNAVRYGNGAPFGLKCEVQPPGLHDGDSRWLAHFEVWDDGPGIDTQDQSAVFQPFLRGRQAHLSHVRGMGMGLAISRQLVRAMGGELELRSAPGMGCRFSFSLRLEQAFAADLEDVESDPQTLPGLHMMRDAEASGPAELMALSDSASHTRQPTEAQLGALMDLLEGGQVSEALDHLSLLERDPALAAFVREARQAVMRLEFQAVPGLGTLRRRRTDAQG